MRCSSPSVRTSASVGRYIRSEGSSRAEIAFAVLDEYQGHGIGTLLLKYLARIARMRGIKEFAAYVLGSNKPMLEVFANSGFRVHDSHESGVARVSLEIEVPASEGSHES
jgi:GNAT superfamily N-acetyltransferase